MESELYKLELERLTSRIDLVVGDITEDIMPLYQQHLEGFKWATIELYKKVEAKRKLSNPLFEQYDLR